MGVVLDGLNLRSFWGSRGTHVLQVDGARAIGSGVSNITVGALAVGRAWCGRVGAGRGAWLGPGELEPLEGSPEEEEPVKEKKTWRS